MARSVVLNEQGQPILVEYNEDGTEGSVISIPGEYADKIGKLRVISAYEYRMEQARLRDYQEHHAEDLAMDAEVLSRTDFMEQTYLTADGQSLSPVELPGYVQSVLVRGRSNRIGNDSHQLVLLSFSVDLSEDFNPPEKGSILLNPTGQVITSSPLNIAPRVGFFGDPEEAQEFYTSIRKNDDKIFGPVKNVKVYVSPEVFPGSLTVTDSKGKYSMVFRLPYCPGGFDYTTDMWAELYYANFSPNGMPALPYYLRRQDWTYCYDLPPFSGGGGLAGAMNYVNAMAVMATMAVPFYNLDMKVDVMFLSGKAVLQNADGTPVEIANVTEYRADNPETLPIAQQFYDLDGDGNRDISVLGDMAEVTGETGIITAVFQPNPNGKLQGVFLSSRPNEGVPHLFRQADSIKNTAPNGVLKSISKEDLRKTDVLVFRESTGELVLERKGLSEQEARSAENGNSTGLGEDDQFFFYRLMLRGPMDYALNLGGGTNRSGTWAEWATRYKLPEPYQRREADHLKSGEWVRLVVINRKTGYMGTQRLQLNDASQNAAGYLSLPVDDITLSPPRLKVWAERNYTQEQGLQQGKEERNNIIGAEGAALASDDLVTIYTEWYDEFGLPLPEGLGVDNGEQYGLTGRLAKVVGQDQLAEVAQGGLAEFPIAPGRHTQVLRIRDNLTAPEHFYIHVTGTQKNENPDFGAAGPSSDEPMDTRPKMLTPFLTPQFHEMSDWSAITDWNRARQAFNAGGNTVKPLKPQPSYLWTYRPEYQFSQYELELHEIERTTAEGDKSDMLDDPQALAGESDQWLDIFYSLLANNNDRLTAIDGPQDLVLAVGEEEIKLTIGEDKTVRFDNLEHLAALNPEDFLSIRLYSNQDAGNILWQYAFDVYGNLSLSRNHSQARYNDESAYSYNIIDSYDVLNIPLETESAVQVNLLDDRKRPVSTLVPSRVTPAGLQHVVILRKDLEAILPRAGTDAYIVVKTMPTNGNRTREKIYEVNLTESINGEMLGQVIEHDTLIQRGSLTLKREDMALKGVGPQLNFIRSFSNESKPENSHDVLSPGWSHNHNIYVQVLAWGDDQPAYDNNLPGWIGATRESSTQPRILDHQTLGNLKNRQLTPSVVAVSNGGSFKRKINNWINQRGNHGTIKQLADGTWEYRSKDGTLYTFEAQMPGQDKAFVKTITDSNGNRLDYSYTTVDNERLLLSVTDLAARQLAFSYSRADNGKMRLGKVENSVGIDLEFGYFPKAASGYDARVGMLKSFKRGSFTETYDYRHLNEDPSVNLSTVIDANGNPTRYEYYDAADVPVDMGGYARGLDEHDLVHKVFYPSATGNEFAEIKYDASATANKREITDLRRNKKTYTLNVLGNPTRLDEPEGKSTTFEWSADMDEPDNLLRKKSDLATNANWEYEYDAHGNMTKETDPYGKTTEQSWDQHFSVLLYRKDKNGNILEQELDSKGNVLLERQTAVVAGAAAVVETRHTYGAAGAFKGALRTTTNGRSFRTEFNYDEFGALASVSEPEGSVTRYENNNRGLRLSETDASGNATTYEYDELDRLTKTIDAEDNSTTYIYDNKGNKKSEEIRDSYLVDGTKHNRYLKLAYTYDSRDRVSAVVRTGNLDGSHPSAGNKTYTYDANSNVLTESDWKGVATTHTYDKLNRRLSTDNRAGNSMSYAYAFENGVKTTITDYAGRTTTEYTDKLGRKTKIVHPAVSNSDGSSATYERVMTYDNLDNVVALRGENNHTTSYLYDGRNLKIKQTNADNKDYRWQYDAAGNLSKTIDEANRTVSYTYDKQNRLLQKDMPEAQQVKYSYYANGTLKKEIDPWRFEYTYTYDKINQRTSVTHPDGMEQESYTKDGKLTFKKDAEGRIVSTLYGPEDRIQLVVDARGRTTTNTYDENNNLVDSLLAWTAIAGPAQVRTHAEYDAEDRVTSQSTAQGSAVEQIVSYQYDDLGNRIEEARPDGRVTRFEYDELNRIKRTETPSVDGLNQDTLQVWDGVGNKTAVTDRRGNTTITEYDAVNRPVKITDADNKIVAFTYDAVGNKLTETNRRGNITQHSYDGLNRETERFVTDGTTRFRLLKNEYDVGGQKKNAVVDANNNRIEVQQDWRGNTLVTTLPAGAGYAQSTSVNAYDKSGFLISASDAAGFTTTYTYFDDGKAATVINPESETTAFEYDIFGNKARITKPLAGVQTLVYDEQNRISQVSDALGSITRFEYDDNNNLVRQFLPAANDSGSTQVEYTYDALNRKRQHIQYKSDGNLSSAFTYDAEGNLTESMDAKGQVFTNTYDVLNRVKEQQFPADSDISSIVTTYDANGNVDTITETKTTGTEITSNVYDLLDRLSSQTQRGRSISYAYDNNGNRTRVTSIGGVTTYIYDSRNRLSTVTAGGITNYRYFANNWLDKVTHANGTAAAYIYDGVGRMLSVHNTLGNGNVLSSFAYSYDDNGNRTQQVETQNGFLTVQTLTTNYRFDTLDRLESYTETSSGKVTEHSFTYYPSYDRKTEKVVSNGVTLKERSYSYNGAYWLTDIAESAGSGGAIAYSYDNNGNSIRKTDTTGGSNQRTLFEYNSRNQLKQVAHGVPNAEVAQGTHDYNYAGMRIRHLGSERGDIEYIYDGDSILDELQNNTATLVAHYRYGDRLLSLVTGGSDQFYHYSALGTTANLTNAAGAQQVAYRTDAFGKITQQEGTSVNRHIFTGQEHDEKTGLIYFGARFYDPDTARFINQDSYLGESTTPPSLHRYLYAYANPTAWVDPTGHYNEAGHYYTTYYVAREVGYDHAAAQELALFSQMPDEVGAFDAIPAKVEETFGAKGKSREELKQNLHDNQRSTHALTGGNAAAEGGKSRDIILDRSNSNAVAGIAIHRLGDTYSHRVMGKKDRTDDATLYKEGLGHFWHGTAPDEIHRRPDLYQDYATDLARTLATRLHGDNQQAVDEAVARAQGKAKEYAELTVELATNNTSKHYREKGPAIDITNHSRTSDETKREYRRRIIRDYSNGDEDFSSSLAKPEANDIPHHKVGDKRKDIKNFVNTIPLDSVGDVNKSDEFIDKAEGAREEYIRKMREKDDQK
jgi:RHS repeat-associated protein